jgi:hypothetical protein
MILGSYRYQKVPQVFQSLIKVSSGDMHDMSVLVVRKPLPMRQVEVYLGISVGVLPDLAPWNLGHSTGFWYPIICYTRNA